MKYIIPIIIFALLLILLLKSQISKQIKQIESIKKLDFSYTTGYAYNANTSYKIECDDKCTITIKPNGYSEENAQEYPISKEQINKIITILNKHNVAKWNGFSKSDKNVLDGNSFHFYLKQNDDSSISATGYMKYPKDYHIVKKELEEIFNGIIKKI